MEPSKPGACLCMSLGATRILMFGPVINTLKKIYIGFAGSTPEDIQIVNPVFRINCRSDCGDFALLEL